MKTQPMSKEFIRGFARLAVLIIGSNVKWTNEERRLFNRSTRKFFGKKRS